MCVCKRRVYDLPNTDLASVFSVVFGGRGGGAEGESGQGSTCILAVGEYRYGGIGMVCIWYRHGMDVV